ncbi:MAG: ATP synthase F1 subunit gamma [Chloroflexi bacterium]|nr:ATP synthase F1 subunit gamma [Chloroflexota bacterium]
MNSTRDLRRRIRSVKNISQVTRALETVSARKVRQAMQLVQQTHPYTQKAWKVLLHLAREPERKNLNPLLTIRSKVEKVLVVMISSDRGLAGAYNVNVVRQTLEHFRDVEVDVSYVPVGRKGRDMLLRRGRPILAEFSNLPTPPKFTDVSAIGYLLVDAYMRREVDKVYLCYTEFESMVKQRVVIRDLLPVVLEFEKPEETRSFNITHTSKAVFEYEPDRETILDMIVPRFIALQVFEAILSAQASEHAARRMAMNNATSNAKDIIDSLQLDYNKMRQKTITDDIIEIASGAESLAQNTY